MKLRVVIAITSTTALMEVNRTPGFIRAFNDIQIVLPEHPITIAADLANESAVRQLLKKNNIQSSLIFCNPNQPKPLANALAPIIESCEAVLVHDACRPLTNPDQIIRVIAALKDEVDAVRPAIAFTETLKIIGPNFIVEGTLDRNHVKRISTPELIRTSVIDLEGESKGWFLPLRKEARIQYVEGNPESLRINSIAERDLLESFLRWKEISV
jgi:hypothetical protein